MYKYFSVHKYILKSMANSRNVCVVVLGDIGRSPRIQYHSKSLAEHNAKVDIICYKESRPLDALEKHTQVSFHYLVPYPNLSLPRILNYILKTLWQAITLMCVLFIIRKPDIMLVQNPPAIPTVFICWLFCTIMRVKYVIDWHNYAFTIMALNVGKNHVLTKMTRAVEMFAGKRAAYNFCVTKEMKTDLKNNYDICATTLYDRPAEIYKPITIEQKHHLLQRLSQTYNAFRGTDTESTMLTKIDEEGIVLRADRPGLIISSTSWTEDEDFSMLLTSLQEYERHIEDGNKRKLPKLICVITGKGPLKEFYCEQINQKIWKFVQIITPWLELEDYPLLLASADLGICLHTSSSGLDLPMKVVDMFGCGLPVLAHDFRCINELVKPNENGYIFRDSKELAEQLQLWFDNFPNNKDQSRLCETFKKNLQVFQELRWKENWDLVASNTFQ